MSFITMADSGERIHVGKVVCVGANYADHNREMGRTTDHNPVLFLKPSSALVRPGESVILPSFSNVIHHELEAVLCIGEHVSSAGPEKALRAVSAVGIGLDLTARDLQAEAKAAGKPWAVSKGFDYSAPVSAFVPYHGDIDLDALHMTLRINGRTAQEGNTSDMLLDSAHLVSYVSRYFSLQPGDLIFTGTPAGVGPVQRGDHCHIEIAGLLEAGFDIT